MKQYLFLLVLISSLSSHAQVDTSYLKHLYDRCLDFSETKVDSILYYAGYIEKQSALLHFNKGDVLSLRLKGLYEELNNNYEKAIRYYLQSLEAARKLGAVEYEISALSDLAIVYSAIKEPQKAKEVYLQCALLSDKHGEVSSVINTYNNLGVIYTQLGQYDSAAILLNLALRLGKSQPAINLSNTYNNLGTLSFRQKQYNEALVYFQRNYLEYLASNDLGGLWVGALNLADAYIEKKQYDSAEYYANRSLATARQLKSESKEADSYAILAKLYERKGNYSKAYGYLKQWYALDTAILNSDTYKSIAELQERFHARQREADNKLLQEKVAKEVLRTRSIMLLAASLGLILLLIAIAFIIKRNANKRLQSINKLIVQQNEKLAELNHEKNALISIVSHDLSTPFVTIQIWGQVLSSGSANLSADQQRAVDKITQAGHYGEELIRRVLDVERADIGKHKMQLENFDLTIFTEHMIESFRPIAARKNIALHAELPGEKIMLLSDKQLVSRICENLLSNAIKYTPKGKNVWVSVSDEMDAVSIKVRDEGVGIEKDELPYLFSKYSKISSTPTDGEASTGLGLSIVKRIVEEVDGKIFCDSKPGEGSLFTVVLKK